MSRDPLLYLDDILGACERVRAYVEGVEYSAFVSDPMRLDATVRNLTIIGEASQRIPADMKASMSEAPWREIAGMRNLLVHAYFGIDTEIVWSAATEKVAPLESIVRRFLNTRSESD
jgi:uncharacterized protein with HEPN domain